MQEEGNSWDVINDNDLWEDGNIDGDVESDQNSYVFVRQEDIMEGIACFMATYLPSLQQTRVCGHSLNSNMQFNCIYNR